jgi:hypothetical protein
MFRVCENRSKYTCGRLFSWQRVDAIPCVSEVTLDARNLEWVREGEERWMAVFEFEEWVKNR